MATPPYFKLRHRAALDKSSVIVFCCKYKDFFYKLYHETQLFFVSTRFFLFIHCHSFSNNEEDKQKHRLILAEFLTEHAYHTCLLLLPLLKNIGSTHQEHRFQPQRNTFSAIKTIGFLHSTLAVTSTNYLTTEQHTTWCKNAKVRHLSISFSLPITCTKLSDTRCDTRCDTQGEVKS